MNNCQQQKGIERARKVCDGPLGKIVWRSKQELEEQEGRSKAEKKKAGEVQ